MADDSEAIERTLSELAELVAESLSDEGWARRDIDPLGVLLLTRPVRDGVFARVEVRLASYRWPQTWPETITVEFGAGYEPALGLMPLVTLPARPCLASESEVSGEPKLSLEIAGSDRVADVADQLAASIRERGTGLAAQYDVDALEAALTDRQQWPAELEAELRPVLLASAGRREQARSALDHYLASDDEAVADRVYQRFARQLRRWLDAGDAEIPPVEQTLSRLPRPPKPEPPSWSHRRQESKDRAAAGDAVRARAGGKTREQISEMLAAEYAVRGLDIAPSALAFGAEMIELEQRPFGKLRGLVRSLRMITSAGADSVSIIRHRPAPNPDWMQPPPRAAYPVHTTRRSTAIALDPAAESVLARAATEATRRIGPIVLVDVWLDTADGDQRVHVYLGEHEIGTLPDDVARLYAPDLRAAAELFDEAVRTRAHLTPASAGKPALVEIGTPAHAAGA